MPLARADIPDQIAPVTSRDGRLGVLGEVNAPSGGMNSASKAFRAPSRPSILCASSAMRGHGRGGNSGDTARGSGRLAARAVLETLGRPGGQRVANSGEMPSPKLPA